MQDIETDYQLWRPDPAKRLENGFRQIQETRMKGLPFVHPKVKVHAVGFHRWTYFWLGAMVTPWAINLVLTEGDPAKWKSVPEGKKLHYRFPAGLYDFISVRDPILGEYKMCSLISPLLEITDDEMAVEVARLSLVELMKEEEPEEEGQKLEFSPREVSPEALGNAAEAALNRPLRRRTFLRSKPLQAEENT